MLRVKVDDVIGFKVLIEGFVFIVTYFHRMQNSLEPLCAQPFPHFHAGDVLETGYDNELYIYIHSTLQTQSF